AKLSTEGTGAVDPIWNPDPCCVIRALALLDTHLFVGGFFSSISGQSRRSLAKISTGGVGEAEPGWNPITRESAPLEIEVYSGVATGSSVFAGGNFQTVGESVSLGIVKLDAEIGRAHV